MRAVLYAQQGSGRAAHVALAMQEGFRRHGVVVGIESAFRGVKGDICLAYGWLHAPVFSAYKKQGARYAYFDLGFWFRKPKGKPRDGFYRLAINDWCSTKLMRRGCSSDRFDRLGISVGCGGDGRSIVVAGMSAKAAGTHGLAPHVWEQRAIDQLRRVTKRLIVYRPKPSWRSARPLLGATYSAHGDITQVLADACSLVTHHSNASVDAIAAGVPVYCERGVGSLMSMVAIQDADKPQAQGEVVRRQFLADVSYCQWSTEEMRSGLCWSYIRELVK